jgi:glucose/arabinose dehydrogenase
VFATTAPGDDRIFVVERSGRIQIIDPGTGAVNASPFLDVTTLTLPSKGIELGLLGLAFHPGYAENGRFFVHYTDVNHDTAVAEYTRLDADRADPGSGRIFVRVAREGLRHNAGMLQFGPTGFLWIAIGDGGLFEVYGQDNTQFLGTILRLDVDGEEPYDIPPDNPFVNGDGAPEVWAYGLRNPWRFDIDAESGFIYIGDVGQANAEEIDAVSLTPDGWNFGWPIMEGPDCWIEPAGCDTAGLTLPIASYSHADGCSVTGGVVYRGEAIPELTGHYFYADWCFGWVRSLLHLDGAVIQEADWSGQLGELGMISSFGVDGDGEILITTSEGLLGRIVPVR